MKSGVATFLRATASVMAFALNGAAAPLWSAQSSLRFSARDSRKR